MQCTMCGFPRSADGGPCLVCSGQWSLPDAPACPGCGAVTSWADMSCRACRRDLLDIDHDAPPAVAAGPGMWDERSVRRAWAKMERERAREARDWSRFRHLAGVAAVVVLLGLMAPVAVLTFGLLDDPAPVDPAVYEAGPGIPAPPADARRVDEPTGSLVGGRATDDLVFRWQYGGLDWEWEMSIEQALIDHYRGRDRSGYSTEYSVFVTDPADDVFLGRLAELFSEAAAEQGYNDHQTLSFLLAFVQSLPYATDDASAGFDEYPRYPVETLVDPGSDCEDTSILFASLAQLLGYDVVLLSPPGHMGVGVTHGQGAHVTFEGKRYVYAETTGAGWSIGQLPSDYAGDMRVYTLVPQAVLGVPTWTAAWDEDAYEVTVTAANVGAAEARGTVLHAAFDAGEGLVWDQATCGPDPLAAGATMTCVLRLQAPPQGETTRLMVRAWAENAAGKVSVSQEFTA